MTVRPSKRRSARLFLAVVGTAVVVAMPLAAAGPALASPAPAFAPAIRLTSLSVSPDRGLVDGQKIVVHVSGGSYGTTYAVAECDPTALLLLAQPSASLQDGCDSRHQTLLTVTSNGTATTALDITAVLTTALGGADCRKEQCLLALAVLHSTGGSPVLVAKLGFGAKACSAPGSCRTPADAWDPSLGPSPSGPVPKSKPVQTLVAPLQPTLAGDLTAPGAVTGPFNGQDLAGTPPSTTTSSSSPPSGVPTTSISSTTSASTTSPSTTTSSSTSPPTSAVTSATTSTTTPTTAATSTTPTVPGTPVAGEGLLRLALEAPGTSWGPTQPSATVVDATLTDITTGRVDGTQQFVLFWGSSPFVYAGFAGPVSLSDRYSVKISVEPPASRGGLSQPSPKASPRVVLLASALEVVSPTNPQYVAYAYAPVMYGRTTSALHDVPLLQYANVTPAAHGSELVSYVVVWSHEDAGTGFLPFQEWGRWGRMTDIENAISFTVGPTGAVSGAKYLWGGEPATGFPDSQTALKEVDTAFTGAWWGHHPVLRDATGNNDFSEHGTTPFRFQMAPVAAPAAGQARDAAMDANPFTYQVMAAEVARWYADTSTSPTSPEPGQAQQYAIVDLGTSGTGVSSVAVNVRLSGHPQWFRSDLGWGYPLVGTGHVRTVVKLPLDWSSERITGVQVVVEPPSAAPTLKVHSLHIERFTSTAIQPVPAPAAVVGPEVLDVAAS